MNNILGFIYKVSDNLCDAYCLNVSSGFKHGLMRDLNISFKRIKINIFPLSLNISTILVRSRIKFIAKILVISSYNFNKILYTFIILDFLNIFL